MAYIKIEDLSYSYPETESLALDNIKAEIQAGEFVLVVGGSGSGKSTLLRAISGLIPNYYKGSCNGTVYLDGKPVRNIDRRQLSQKVGMLFQNPESQLVMTGVEREIVFGMENIGLPNKLMRRRVAEVSTALGLSGCMRTAVSALSGGQKQKVALASILAMQPSVLVLDEPTSQLDPVAAEEILNMIRHLNEENGITVIIAEQRLERCFHLADRILVMDRGKLVYQDRKPKAVARWAVKNNSPFIPPLARVFAGVNYPQVPATVKEGRQILGSYSNNKCSRYEHPEEAKLENFNKEKNILDIQKLWFSYPNGKEALKNINLGVQAGDFVVIIGDNGAGKSTLLKAMNGLHKPGKGKVIAAGRDTRKVSVEQLSPYIGYLSQDPGDHLFLPTVREEIDFTLKNLGLSTKGVTEEMMEQFHLTPYADINPRDLSTGERQRVVLASVLASKPSVLLLDEPTRGLDYSLKEQLGNLLLRLNEHGTAVMMISHDLDFAAEYAKNILLMSEGSIIASGNKYEMLSNSTFYSPQISKLFSNIEDDVLTVEEGKKVLLNLMESNEVKALSL
ncbi:MAG: energy-coupling factor transporter ATPase [Bacillota bacterium]|nr:energy-coupling factor transporter ATPase [Bacillota bacterium]